MTTLQDVLNEHHHRHSAIGHFNVSDLVALRAVTDAARELTIPVLVGTSEGERSFWGVREVAAVVASCARGSIIRFS
jgi:fructose-bisphosphate aldolase class II